MSTAQRMEMVGYVVAGAMIAEPEAFRVPSPEEISERRAEMRADGRLPSEQEEEGEEIVEGVIAGEVAACLSLVAALLALAECLLRTDQTIPEEAREAAPNARTLAGIAAMALPEDRNAPLDVCRAVRAHYAETTAGLYSQSLSDGLDGLLRAAAGPTDSGAA